MLMRGVTVVGFRICVFLKIDEGYPNYFTIAQGVTGKT